MAVACSKEGAVEVMSNMVGFRGGSCHNLLRPGGGATNVRQ